MRFELARMVRNVMRLALVGVACVGCGDDDSNGSGGSCEFKACGGDVVGTWEVDTACITFNEEPVPGDEPACEGAFRGADFSITGQQTFSEDGTTTLDFELSGSIDYTLDNECLQALANLTASDFVCSQLASFLAAAGEIQGGSCSFTRNTCRCTIETHPQLLQSTETYSVEGNEIVYADSEPAEFCVKGDRLHLRTDTDVVSISGVMTRVD